MMLTLSTLLLALSPVQGRQVVEPVPEDPTQDALNQVLTVHDAHDLMPEGIIPPAVSEALQASGLDDVLVADVEKLIADRTAQDQLVELIRTWVPIEPEAQLEATREGMLLANMTLASHDELLSFLQVQRSGPRSYNMEFKVIEVPTRDLPVSLFGVSSSTPLDDHQTRAYRERVATNPLAEQLFMPTIASIARQEFSVLKTHQEAYIADVSIHRDRATNTQTVDPIVNVVQEGFILRGHAVPLFGDRVGIEINLEVAEISRPIATMEFTPEFATTPITLQLPEVTTISTKTELSLDSPGAFVLSVPLPHKESRLFLEGVVRPATFAAQPLEAPR